jgi:hypothetical protein
MRDGCKNRAGDTSTSNPLESSRIRPIRGGDRASRLSRAWTCAAFF